MKKIKSILALLMFGGLVVTGCDFSPEGILRSARDFLSDKVVNPVRDFFGPTEKEEPSQQQGDQGGQQGGDQSGDQGGDQTPAHVHNFVFNSFVWTETPGAYSAKAKYVCAEDSAEEFHDATVTELSRVGATCTEAGSITWHAVYESHEENRVENVAALGHDMTRHQEVAASCTENGSKEYWTCSRESDVYFKDELGTETYASADELVIPATGHDMVHHDAVAANCTEAGSKEYWTCSHEDGVLYKDELGTETYASADELVVPAIGHDMLHHAAVAASCTEAGSKEYWTCSHEAGVLYKDELGAEKYASADELVVAALGHNMTHHEAHSATCTSEGNLEYWSCDRCSKLFLDENGVSETDLASLTVAMTAHNYQETAVTDKIGYFELKCSECGASDGLSANKMTLADIDFTKAQYGAHGGKWDTNVQPTAKTMTFEVTDGNEENEIFLPKINFSLYKVVKFTLSGNDWSARVGLETGSYAFPYAYRAEPYSGELTFVTNGNQVKATLSCAEGTTQNLVISDADILSGAKSVSLFMIADAAYRSISAELTMLADECSHNYVVSNAKLGAEVCSVCGDEKNYITALGDVDFTVNQYGAHGGKWDTNVQPTAKTMKFEVTAGDTEDTVYLPKINFKAFPAVKFNVTCGSFAIGAGLESDNYVLPGSSNSGDPAHTGLLTLQMNENSLDATLTCKETSTNQQVSITNADIINGDASVVLYMYSVAYAYQELTFELVALDNSCVHNFVADPNCIGKEVCSVCNEARAVTPSYDFTANLYGACDIYKPWGDYAQDGWARADSATQISYVNYTVGDNCEYYLPKMYFAGFSSITIDITSNYNTSLYALDSSFATSFEAPFAGYSMKLVFDNITSTSMTVKLLDAFSTVQVQATCSDANVLNGLASFIMYSQGSGNVGWDAFANFTFAM